MRFVLCSSSCCVWELGSVTVTFITDTHTLPSFFPMDIRTVTTDGHRSGAHEEGQSLTLHEEDDVTVLIISSLLMFYSTKDHFILYLIRFARLL